MGAAGVVLAAGGGTRFAASGGTGSKLLADLGGRPVLHRALEAAIRGGLAPVYVVAGAVDLEIPGSPPLPHGVLKLHNPDWTGGLATSLQVALDSARQADHDALVVGLGDQPFVTPEAWRRVSGSTSSIAVATYDGVRGHPVRLAADIWPLLPVAGDSGARELIRARPELVDEVPCSGHPGDIDTVQDLARWR